MNGGWTRLGVALLWMVAVGCDDYEAVEHPRGEEAWAIAHDVDVAEEEVVATVDGAPITGADVRAAWRDRPEMSAAEVLDYLVERELLAQRAKREQLHDRPEVAFARKQGLVQSLLYEEIEKKTESDDDRRQEMLEQVRGARRLPEGLRASHLVITVPDSRRVEDGEEVALSEEQREEMYRRAHRWVEEAQDRLGDRPDDDALRAVAEELNEKMSDEESEAVVNAHLRFPRHEEVYRPEHLPDGWTPVVEAFAKGAEEVAGDDRRGTLSQPVRSEFGWHLIRVDEAMEERVVDPEAAEAFVDHQLKTEARRRLLTERMEQWAEGVPIELYPDRLGSAYDDGL